MNKNETNKLIGQAIRRIREIKRFSRKEFAEKLKCSVSAISNWENGLRDISSTTLDNMAEILGIPSIIEFYDDLYQATIPKKDIEDAKIDEINSVTDKAVTWEILQKLNTISDKLDKLSSIISYQSLKIGIELMPVTGPSLLRKIKFISQPFGSGKILGDCKLRGILRFQTTIDVDYAFRVEGSNMTMLPEISEGDLLLIKANRMWKESDVVLVFIPDTTEWIIKQIFFNDKTRRQIALKGSTDVRIFNEKDVFIHGIIKQIIKDERLIEEIINELEQF